MQSPTPVDPFHKHLGTCAQCRNKPFGLCTVGAAGLRQAVSELVVPVPVVARDDAERGLR